MAEIGKSLVFYLKYYAEMNRLYQERGTIPGINPSDDHDLRKKIEDLGHAAGVEARHLLEHCISDLRNRVEATGLVELAPGRDEAVERKWDLHFDVRPVRGKRTSFKLTWIGLNLSREGLIPWVWRRGGLAIEEDVRNCFAKGVRSFGSKVYQEWGAGSVGLETIPIPWQSAESFTVEANDIIKRTQEVCQAIDTKFLQKLILLP